MSEEAAIPTPQIFLPHVTFDLFSSPRAGSLRILSSRHLKSRQILLILVLGEMWERRRHPQHPKHISNQFASNWFFGSFRFKSFQFFSFGPLQIASTRFSFILWFARGEFALECYEIFRSRNGVYRNAFMKMPTEAITAFIIGKAHRVKALIEVDGAREKILDDLKDIVNYCFMLMAKKNDALCFGDFMLMCFLERENDYENLTADQLIEKMIENADKLRENDGSGAPKKLVTLAYLLAARTQPPYPFSSGRGNAEKYAQT